ncbi:MAG: aldo/keto reductase [Candidatus Methanomethylicota archaeon]|uniref:Aldo/keto reductase n=1 Tax=Thermoproteota archaeon TaxID=2056631 RepID=A0A497F2W2_9CREN|nr:MAG: aldo/keto reductase [Candidatus Verstraetearchaeota archaeon]
MYRVLGRTRLKVSILGFGGIPIRTLTLNEAVKVVRRAYEVGVNFYDTARNYVDSERKIGAALKDVRSEVYIATKTASRSYEDAMKDLEVSLAELGTSYIDVWQLHGVNNFETLERVLASDGALAALKDAKQDGRVRFIGITGHRPDVLVRAIETGEFDTVQFPFNYLSTEAGKELIPRAEELDVGMIVMKPLAGGELSSARAALRFIVQYPISTVIPGMKSIEEVEENAKTLFEEWKLTDEDLKIIDEDKQRLDKIFCRGCMYCLPCPQEIPISSLLRVESIIRRIGVTDSVRKIYEKAKEKVPNCVRCRQCEEKCPYNLPITEMLPKKLAWLEEVLMKVEEKAGH